MSIRILEFPKGFRWGTATAAHQNEGYNTKNDFWAWEQKPGHVADGTTSGAACDWWERAEEDFDRAAALGHNTLRLSLEWSRLEPERGRWNDGAFDRYRQMLTGLRQRGLVPMLTLHHFTNPFWLAQLGGWLTPAAVTSFERFAAQAIDQLGDLCQLWCTINEPMVYAFVAYLSGQWSPGHNSLRETLRVAANLARAHAAAYRAIKRRQPDARVGIVTHMPIFEPASQRLLDRRAAAWQDIVFNQRILDAVSEGRLKFPLNLFNGRRAIPQAGDGSDFWGLNYYGRYQVAFDPRAATTLFGRHVVDPSAEYWDEPWPDREIYAVGLYRCLRRLARYGKPIYVTENGLDDVNDARRPQFLLTHLAALHRAIREGADVRGYYHWTLVDNYEWTEGWTTRFGLIALDPQTQRRTLRRSAELYARIAKSNAISEDIVAEYAPQVMDLVFGEKEA
jgi:beta-glucosidase